MALEGTEVTLKGADGGIAEAISAHFFGEGKEAVGHDNDGGMGQEPKGRGEARRSSSCGLFSSRVGVGGKPGIGIFLCSEG